MSKPQASVTVVINSIAQAKKAQGIRVYNLSAGEPKLKTPEIVRKAAIKFVEAGDIPYPSPAGENVLRKAAVDRMARLYKTDYTTEECIITTGGKFGIYLLLEYLCGQNSPIKQNPNDEVSVMIPAPYWVSYPAIAKIMGGKPVIMKSTAKDGWKLTPEILRSSYNSSCKILFLNNGCNPTGIIYSRNELKALMDLAHELGLTVISDEVYSSLVYTDDEYVSCGSFTEYKDDIIVVQSASKSFAMTGWRVGFVMARKDIIEVLSALSTQSTTGVSLIVQHSAIGAFEHADEITTDVRVAMKRRRDVMMAAVKEFFNLDLPMPKATLYLWISLEDLNVHGVTDDEFCIRALEEANVATVPGSGFGQAGYVRLSFGAEEDDLHGGIAALAKFAKQFN